MKQMNFDLVLSNARRDDDYVNATVLCKQFGVELKHFNEAKRTKELKALLRKDRSEKPTQLTVKKQTYVCPELALELARWLSPEFHKHMLDVFKAYTTADITLADDILQRQTDPAKVEWLQQRTEGKLVRLEFSAEVDARATGRFKHAQATNAIYEPLLGGTAKALKEQRQVKNLRDGMTALELMATKFAEACATERMRNQDAQGLTKVKQCASSAASDVKTVLDNN